MTDPFDTFNLYFNRRVRFLFIGLLIFLFTQILEIAFWLANCRTLPKIADDDMEAVFYALDDSGDFKVHYIHLYLESPVACFTES